MSIRISEAFKNKKAFIPFITCGDPSLEVTEKLIYTLEDAGASLIELGIPFSDPTAEGEVIQGANLRALENNVTTDKIFEMVERISVSVPLVFMTYANIVFSYGIEKFAKRCKEISISGIILPDIPFEEKEEFKNIFKEYGIEFISLIAPTSKDRIKLIAKEAEGFIYLVSSLGVTGVRNKISGDIDTMVKLVREVTNIPIAVGFGISTEAQVSNIVEKANGVIVGSAIIKIIEKYKEDSISYVREYIEKMAKCCER